MLLGAIAATCFVASLFFLRFWQTTRDRFFLFFTLFFTIGGCERIIMALTNPSNEQEPPFYILRLIAFLILLYAIVDKNRARK